ncbi:ABC-three component system middle component 2 [Dactylosporangium sucinum]|uniref:Threonine transporter n=1 Tax=Dactylosporangium sucinum TaxID=1424081 RepID=A0A917T6K9_9ACTN|nr:ABC-three component system middle component 2 [Dactylosporangium sucinum]GGM11393.1 hypothetical protein GCM10007977_010680 [Dactylosporangium sucinum]
MLNEPLNGPLETGLRALAILDSAFPRSFDLATLAFLDYCVVHSQEFGGPESLHPAVPNHESEIAVKQELLELGLQVMVRARLATLRITPDGIGYAASDAAAGFIELLESSYMHELRDRADWVNEHFGGLDSAELRGQMFRLGRHTSALTHRDVAAGEEATS